MTLPEKAFFTGMLLGFVIGFAIGLGSKAFALDRGQYQNADPELKRWIEDLKDKKGVSCCNTADGFDVQWDTKDGKYRVYIYNNWYVVPDEAVLEVPNKIGVARVWYTNVWEFGGKITPKIRCFLPGAGG